MMLFEKLGIQLMEKKLIIVKLLNYKRMANQLIKTKLERTHIESA